MSQQIQPGHRNPTDKEIDLSVARMLRLGVTLAAAIVLAGGVLELVRAGSIIPDYTRFHPATPALSTVHGIVAGALLFHAPAIIQFGLLILIATPVARVGLCLVGFARQRDKLYVAVSLVVLLILIFSLLQRGR